MIKKDRFKTYMPNFEPQIIVFNINDADSSLFQKNAHLQISHPYLKVGVGKKQNCRQLSKNVLSASFMPKSAFFHRIAKSHHFQKLHVCPKRRQKTARQLIFYIICIFIYLIRVRGDIILYIFIESYCLAVFCLLNI